MKDPTKIRRAEVVKVNRQTLLSLVNSLEIAAGEIEKNGIPILLDEPKLVDIVLVNGYNEEIGHGRASE